jgi:2-polyprenyl-6-methoxyphenol hydroxylase-like FAD-dependent oxidoreductase
MSADDYDVAIVGASTAGCTAARLFALGGARVALVEKRPALDAYKTVCTHFIQSSARPTIEKLGLAERLQERGAIDNVIDLWTRDSGWIRNSPDAPHGFNVTRRTLDPILRGLAADTPGVELLSGWTATGLIGEQRPTGVTVENPAHEQRSLRARLVVAADGRDSKMALWAGVEGRERPHNRFFYWGYWRGIRPTTERSKMWILDPDCAYTFPNEDDLTVVLVGPHRDRLPEFRQDLAGSYRRMVNSLPEGPDLRDAELEGKLLGKLDLPNVMRPAAKPGLALVGDAALASDPLWGVGCGWAFQSADWLVQETGDALDDPVRLDAGLERYRRVHRRRLLPHHMMIADLSTGRPINPIERRLYRAAARDEVVRAAFERVGSRRSSPATVLDPRVLARVIAARPRRASPVAH